MTTTIIDVIMERNWEWQHLERVLRCASIVGDLDIKLDNAEVPGPIFSSDLIIIITIITMAIMEVAVVPMVAVVMVEEEEPEVEVMDETAMFDVANVDEPVMKPLVVFAWKQMRLVDHLYGNSLLVINLDNAEENKAKPISTVMVMNFWFAN